MTLKRDLSISTILCLSVLPVLLHSQSSQSLRSLSGCSGAFADRRSLIQQMVNSVSRENIVNNIRALQAFGNRYEFYPQREAAADWIIKELGWWGIPALSDYYLMGYGAFNTVNVVAKDTAWLGGANGQLLLTKDGGQTWTSIPNPLSSSSVGIADVDFISSKVGWIVGANISLYRTIDGGMTWSSQTIDTRYSLIDVGFAGENSGIGVTGGGQIFKTADGGFTWRLVYSGDPLLLRKIALIDAKTFCVVGDRGTILRSTDGGDTWLLQPTGVSASLLGVAFANSRLGWTAGNQNVLLKTTNGGYTWLPNPTNLPPANRTPTYTSVCFADSLTGWITEYFGGLLHTTDGGRSWSRIFPANRHGWLGLQSIGQAKGSFICLAGIYGRVMTSTNGGGTWKYQTPNLPPLLLHHSRNIGITLPGRVTPSKECVMVAHYDGVPDCPAADDNASGTSALMEAARVLHRYDFESTVRLLAVSGEELGMIGSEQYVAQAKSEGRDIVGAINADMIGYSIRNDTARFTAGSYLVRNRLIDSALTYNQRYNIGLKLETYLDTTAASDFGPFALAGYDALQLSEGSATEIWSGFNPHYHKASDILAHLHPGLMQRATQLVVAILAEMAGPVGPAALPATFALEQNYPNPFNAGTSIRFSLPQSSNAKLRVYDVLGKLVATLYDGMADSGHHRFAWTATGMPSGVYFCRLQTGSYSETRKLVLIR